ncbi:MAG: GyrI-like domain-containing protein [Gemmatimonadales bacterium]|nr:GyrI-like domain-containing protein [Gemmatimonadales bacterium]
MGAKAREKLDLHKLHHREYAAPHDPSIIEVGTGRYLVIAGRGRPGGPEFQAKLGALYGMAFTIKMTRKQAGKGDYVVAGLEGQYWPDTAFPDPFDVPLDTMNWRLLVRTPEAVTEGDVDAAARKLESRGKGEWVREVALFSMAEGACVQMLHVGPYADEPHTIRRMTAFSEERGYEVHGQHHEIYLSDPRRVPPERLRTILRLPIRVRTG